MRASRARQAVRRAEAELVQSGSQSDWTNTPVDSCLSLTNCFVGETRHSARRGQRELVRDAHRHGWHSPRLLTFSAGWRLQRANRVLPEPAEFNGSGKQRRIRRGMHEGSKDNRRAAYRNARALGTVPLRRRGWLRGRASANGRDSQCPQQNNSACTFRHGSCPVRFENRSLRRHSFLFIYNLANKKSQKCILSRHLSIETKPRWHSGYLGASSTEDREDLGSFAPGAWRQQVGLCVTDYLCAILCSVCCCETPSLNEGGAARHR